VDWKLTLHSLLTVNPWWFAVLVLMTPIHFFTRAARWYFLLKHEKKNVTFYSMVAGNAVGFMVSAIFPARLGEIVKPLYVAQREGMRKGFVLGTVVVERIFDMFAMCFLLGAFFVAQPLFLHIFRISTNAVPNLALYGIIGMAIATGLLLVSLSLYFFKEKTLKTARFFLKPLPERFTRWVMSLADEFIEGLKFFHSAGNVIIYGAMSLFVWLAIILYYWVLFFAFHVHVPYFSLIPYVFLTMVGASIPTPAMLGGYEWFSKLGMTTLFGIDANLAVGMTLVMHVLQVVVTVVMGYAILWKDGLSLFQLKRLGENENR
jgi:glycosyltransferase 2 family protein